MKLLFELINFLLLVGGLVWLYRRYRLGRFLESYRARVTAEIRKAREMEAEADHLHLQAEEELAGANKRAQEILENAKGAGARMLEEQRAAAQIEAQRILTQARQEVELTRTRALAELQHAAAEELIARATEFLIEETSEEDQRRLVGNFLAKLDRGILSE